MINNNLIKINIPNNDIYLILENLSDVQKLNLYKILSEIEDEMIDNKCEVNANTLLHILNETYHIEGYILTPDLCYEW
jgi:hypothetical protein